MAIALTITNKTFDVPWIITAGDDVYIGSKFNNIVVRKCLLGSDWATPVSWDKDREWQWGNNCPFLCRQALMSVTSTTFNTANYSRSKPYHSHRFLYGSWYVSWTTWQNLWWGSTVAKLNLGAEGLPTKQQEIERQWPCPDGYHIPNWYEFSQLHFLFAQTRGWANQLNLDVNWLYQFPNNVPAWEFEVFRNLFGIGTLVYPWRNSAAALTKSTNVLNLHTINTDPVNSKFVYYLSYFIGTWESVINTWTVDGGKYILPFKNRFS